MSVDVKHPVGATYAVYTYNSGVIKNGTDRYVPIFYINPVKESQLLRSLKLFRFTSITEQSGLFSSMCLEVVYV